MGIERMGQSAAQYDEKGEFKTGEELIRACKGYVGSNEMGWGEALAVSGLTKIRCEDDGGRETVAVAGDVRDDVAVTK